LDIFTFFADFWDEIQIHLTWYQNSNSFNMVAESI